MSLDQQIIIKFSIKFIPYLIKFTKNFPATNEFFYHQTQLQIYFEAISDGYLVIFQDNNTFNDYVKGYILYDEFNQKENCDLFKHEFMIEFPEETFPPHGFDIQLESITHSAVFLEDRLVSFYNFIHPDIFIERVNEQIFNVHIQTYDAFLSHAFRYHLMGFF